MKYLPGLERLMNDVYGLDGSLSRRISQPGAVGGFKLLWLTASKIAGVDPPEGPKAYPT
jgi:hypothetical protein